MDKQVPKKKEESNMGVAAKKTVDNRPCTPTKSLDHALQEMVLMRKEQMKKRTWKEFKKK